MSLKKDIFGGGYIDDNCLVSTSNTGGTDNGVMYTGEFVVLLDDLGELTPAMKQYWRSTMDNVEVKRGVIKRSPTNDRDDEGPDDYHGYLCGAKRCDPKRAKDFIWNWFTALGVYDSNKKLGWKDFMWRFPQLLTHAWFATGWYVPAPLRIFFIASLLIHAYRKVPTSDQDARRLGWLLIKNWDGKGIVSRWAVQKWNSKLLSEYPNGMRDVAKSYYGADFPFTRYISRT